MIADIIVDLQYGDCGKGKVTHTLLENGDYTHCIRYNGDVMQVTLFITRVKSSSPITSLRESFGESSPSLVPVVL
jgi:hypothetical protein